MQEYLVHEEKLGDYTLKIYYEEFTISPIRDGELVSNFQVYTGRNYNIGDDKEFEDKEDLEKFLKQEARKGNLVFMPLKFRDYGGNNIKLQSCESKNLIDEDGDGYIFITKKNLEYWNGGKNRFWRKEAYQIMINEIKYYNLYLSGECYYLEISKEKRKSMFNFQDAYINNENTEIIEECGNIIDDLHNVIKYALIDIEGYIKQDEEEARKNHFNPFVSLQTSLTNTQAT